MCTENVVTSSESVPAVQVYWTPNLGCNIRIDLTTGVPEYGAYKEGDPPCTPNSWRWRRGHLPFSGKSHLSSRCSCGFFVAEARRCPPTWGDSRDKAPGRPAWIIVVSMQEQGTYLRVRCLVLQRQTHLMCHWRPKLQKALHREKASGVKVEPAEGSPQGEESETKDEVNDETMAPEGSPQGEE